MKMDDVKVIAWDFDGVLNNNIENGRFVWSRTFERDLGLPLADFHTYLFHGRFQQAMVGDADLKDLISDWLKTHDTAHSADDILDYWFARDALTDAQMLSCLKQVNIRGRRNIIATNNEVYRANYIEHDMGFSQHVDQIFAAGRMRIAKPSLDYFKHIEQALRLPPSAFLLIDDMAENIDAAWQAGWKAHHHTENNYTDLARILL